MKKHWAGDNSTSTPFRSVWVGDVLAMDERRHRSEKKGATTLLMAFATRRAYSKGRRQGPSGVVARSSSTRTAASPREGDAHEFALRIHSVDSFRTRFDLLGAAPSRYGSEVRASLLERTPNAL